MDKIKKTPIEYSDLELYFTQKAMKNYGGSFACSIVAAMEVADRGNSAVMRGAFRPLFEKYGPGSSFYRTVSEEPVFETGKKKDVEVGKTYVDGNNLRVRIICTDRVDSVIPVVGLLTPEEAPSEAVRCYTIDGKAIGKTLDDNLVREACEWDDVPMDTLCWVKCNKDNIWYARYFYKVEHGTPLFFNDGRTSETASEGVFGGGGPDKLGKVSSALVATHWPFVQRNKPV